MLSEIQAMRKRTRNKAILEQLFMIFFREWKELDNKEVSTNKRIEYANEAKIFIDLLGSDNVLNLARRV